jgi:predicted DNA-binding transcriptional regulator AlpA
MVSDDLRADDLLNKQQVAELLGIRIRTLERWVSVGSFPAPMKVGNSSHCLRWRKARILAYLEKLERDAS